MFAVGEGSVRRRDPTRNAEARRVHPERFYSILWGEYQVGRSPTLVRPPNSPVEDRCTLQLTSGELFWDLDATTPFASRDSGLTRNAYQADPGAVGIRET